VARDDVTGVTVGHPPGWERVATALTAITLGYPLDVLPPDTFRPTITVTVEPALGCPDPLQTVSRGVLAGLLQAIPGLQLVSLDAVTLRGRHDGRRLVSVYRQPPFAVELTQWWLVSDGIVTSVSASCGIPQAPAVRKYVDYALSCLEPADRLPAGTPAVLVPPPVELDRAALAESLRLEDLGWIAAAQPFRREGPQLGPDGWLLLAEVLHRPALRGPAIAPRVRAAVDVLIEHELLTATGEPTAAGATIGRTLDEPTATFRVEAGRSGRRHDLRIACDARQAVVLASASPATLEGPAGAVGSDGRPDLDDGLTLDVVEPAWVPAVIASWMGLAPAWMLADLPDRLPRELFTTRCDDPATPPPDGASGPLRALWAQDWVLCGLRTTRIEHAGPLDPAVPGRPADDSQQVLILAAGARGTYRIEDDPAQPSVALRPVPPYLLWQYLKDAATAALHRPTG
jgi:hypothetical protein